MTGPLAPVNPIRPLVLSSVNDRHIPFHTTFLSTFFPIRFFSISGTLATLRLTATRRRGDEAGSDLAGLRAVPQNLHSEAREREVSPEYAILSNTFLRKTHG